MKQKNLKICTYCGHLARREGCGARKIAEYIDAKKIALIHHFGHHRCKLKPPVKQRKAEIRLRLEQAGQKFPTMSAQEFVEGQITECQRNKDMRAAK
jgi:hypothetical protein